MTSKAERKRRKRAARTMSRPDLHAQPEAGISFPAIQPFTPLPKDGPTARGGLTDLQEAALLWFAKLRRDRDAGGAVGALARPQLDAVRFELTADEFSILSELCRSPAWINERVGRSRQTVRELQMSALRKLVIYRASSGLQDEGCAA